MISSVIWGLAFWAILAIAGAKLFGTVEGLALWRVFFLAGYAGYIQGLICRPSTNEEKAT